MPYGEKSAYKAQAKLKGQSPVYKKSSGFKMKSSPTKIYGKKAAPVKNYKEGYYGA